jgi:hypothetical protein
VEKTASVEYALHMNNREWYAEALKFCQLSPTCNTCPYHLLTGQADSSEPRPCFADKQALLKLDAWLSAPHDREGTIEETDDDNQWLKELLKVQFDEEDEDWLLDEELC